MLNGWIGAVIVLAALSTVACGGDGESEADRRAEQARAAAADAGLDGDTQDFLELAARGIDATYEVTFRTTAGDETNDVAVSQRPPNRRVDITAPSGETASSFVLGGTAYECSKPSDGEWVCERSAELASAGVATGGVFDEEALQETIAALRTATDTYSITIERRTVAEIDARCMISEPKQGDAATDMLCLSPHGAIVLIEQGDARTAATSYTTDVADDRFELPADPRRTTD